MADLSIIIPAYNEEKRIGNTLERTTEFLEQKNIDYEIIVVDDGSQDDTVQVVTQYRSPRINLICNQLNRGKGYSIRRGMLDALGRLRLFSDADLSTPIEELDRLVPYIEQGFGVVIGSRGLKSSQILVHQPWYRESMGRFFNFLVRFLVLTGVKDTQCGFKLFTAQAANDIFSRQQLSGFAFDVEVLVLAKKLGYRIKEVPVRWINSPASRVSPLLDSLKMFIDLIRIRLKRL